jgi:acetyltransferase-like isoleucine patch superfamily enzyme
MLRSFTLRVQRGEGPFYGFLKRSYFRVLRFSFTPRLTKPFFHFLYYFHQNFLLAVRQFLNIVYFGPLFKSRCASVGKNLHVWRLPYLRGPIEVFIGDDVEIFGKVTIFSGRIFEHPRLVIGNRVDIGHEIQFSINREVVIEDEVNIASLVHITDTDAHPRDTEARVQGAAAPPDEIKPVRICRRAWLGGGCWIMKGVTIGEGAVVGVNSVVLTDVPPYAVVMGNPARIVVKDVRPAPPQPAAP